MEQMLKFFLLMLSLTVCGLVGYAGVTAINAFQRKSGRQDPTIDPAELDEIRGQVADVDQLRTRLADVEERLDFTERLLAQHQEPPRLGGGAS
jgi:Tfp pilus assembly protein PilO